MNFLQGVDGAWSNRVHVSAIKTHIAFFVAVLLMSIASRADATTYRGAPIEGQVIDAETKQPLEGVVVVAEWLLYGGFFHGDVRGRLLIQEAVTDTQGRYSIPAWGPLRPPQYDLDRRSPRISFYKVGYRFLSHGNEGYYAPYIPLPDPLTSEWSGKTIELTAFKRPPAAGTESLELGEAGPLFRLYTEPCAWEQFPRMTAQVLRRSADYRNAHASPGFILPEELYNAGKCADPAVRLKEYQ